MRFLIAGQRRVWCESVAADITRHCNVPHHLALSWPGNIPLGATISSSSSTRPVPNSPPPHTDVSPNAARSSKSTRSTPVAGPQDRRRAA